MLLQARNNAMHELNMLCEGHPKIERRVVDKYADLVGPARRSESFEVVAKRRRESLRQQLLHLLVAFFGRSESDPAVTTDACTEGTDTRARLESAISEMSAWRERLLSSAGTLGDQCAKVERQRIEEQVADAIRVIDDTLDFLRGFIRVLDEDGYEAALRAMARFSDKTRNINVFCQPALLMPSAETVPRLLFRDGERLLRNAIRAKCALSADDPAGVLKPPSYEDAGLVASIGDRPVSATTTSGIRVTHDPRHPSEQPGQIIDTAL